MICICEPLIWNDGAILSNSFTNGANIPVELEALPVGIGLEGIEYRRHHCWPCRLTGRARVGRSFKQYRDALRAIMANYREGMK